MKKISSDVYAKTLRENLKKRKMLLAKRVLVNNPVSETKNIHKD